MGRRVAFWGENKQGSEGAEPLDSHFLYGPRSTPFSFPWAETQS